MEGYFTIPYRVRAADINYSGHLGNSAVLDIFQDVRIAFLAEIGPYGELDIGGCGIILSQAHLYYKSEVFIGDQLTVGVRCKEIKRTSFVLAYRIERQGVITAEGETTAVCFDYEQRRPARMPKDFRQRLFDF